MSFFVFMQNGRRALLVIVAANAIFDICPGARCIVTSLWYIWQWHWQKGSFHLVSLGLPRLLAIVIFHPIVQALLLFFHVIDHPLLLLIYWKLFSFTAWYNPVAHNPAPVSKTILSWKQHPIGTSASYDFIDGTTLLRSRHYAEI